MNARDTTEFLSNLTEKNPSGKTPPVILFHGTKTSEHKLKMLDWKLGGGFSKLISQKIISGEYGKVTLAPLLWNGTSLSFYIIGMGELKEPDAKLKSLLQGLSPGVTRGP